MSDDLFREILEAARILAARKANFERSGSLDAFFLERACLRAASQPRNDETVNELPVLGLPTGTDLVPIWRNGQTFQTTAALLASLATPSSSTSLNLVNVKTFGNNVGTGGDDSAAILAAAAAANAVKGSALYFPPNPVAYNYNQTVNGPIRIANTYGCMMGFGRTSTINFTGTTGDCVLMSDPTGFQSIEGVFLVSTTAVPGALPASGYIINYAGGGDPKIRNVNIQTSGHGIGYTNTVAQLFATLESVRIVCTGTSNIGWDIQTVTSSLIATDVVIQGSSFINTSTNIGIRFAVVVAQDTFQFSNVNIGAFNVGIEFGPQAGGVVSDGHLSNCVIDQTFYAVICSAGGLTGTINRVKFDNCWIASGLGVGGAGTPIAFFVNNSDITSYNMTFTGCRFYALSGNAVTLNTSNTSTQFIGCIFEISTIGFYVVADAQFDLLGCTFVQNTTALQLADPSANSWTAAHGKQIANCSFYGNTTALVTAAAINTYGGLVSIRNCPGLTPVGAQTAPAIAATTVYVANPFPYDCMVYVSLNGSTMTDVKIKTPNAGISDTGLTAGAYLVQVGCSIALLYSAGTPAWAWFAA